MRQVCSELAVQALLVTGLLSGMHYEDEPAPKLFFSMSIYRHIAQNLDATGVLKASGMKLPDAHRYPGTEVFGSGSLEGAFQEAPQQDSTEIADEVYQGFRRMAMGQKGDQDRLYQLFCEDHLMCFIDDLMDMMIREQLKITDPLYQFFLKLVLESDDRGPVKMGIAMLGLIRDRQSAEDIRILGRHDAFTLFAAVALTNIHEDPQQPLFELARHVRGWGRIQMVERLLERPTPQIQEWLLRCGFRNTWNCSYQALACARHGGLKDALMVQAVDDAMLESAGALLEAMLRGGLHEDLDAYLDAPQVIDRYLHHLGQRPTLARQDEKHLQALIPYLESRTQIENETAAGALCEEQAINLLIEAQRLMQRMGGDAAALYTA